MTDPEDAFDALSAAFWEAQISDCRYHAEHYAIRAAEAFASSIAWLAMREWAEAAHDLRCGKAYISASLMFRALQAIAEALARSDRDGVDGPVADFQNTWPASEVEA